MEELPKKALLRPRELAEFWDVSVQTIYRWIDMGILGSVKKSGTIRIPQKEARKIKIESG